MPVCRGCQPAQRGKAGGGQGSARLLPRPRQTPENAVPAKTRSGGVRVEIGERDARRIFWSCGRFGAHRQSRQRRVSGAAAWPPLLPIPATSSSISRQSNTYRAAGLAGRSWPPRGRSRGERRLAVTCLKLDRERHLCDQPVLACRAGLRHRRGKRALPGRRPPRPHAAVSAS